jgi:hypothetical protein
LQLATTGQNQSQLVKINRNWSNIILQRVAATVAAGRSNRSKMSRLVAATATTAATAAEKKAKNRFTFCISALLFQGKF